jgi:hypothetical protein
VGDGRAAGIDQEVGVRVPRFRIVWLMVAVSIAALNFAAIRAVFDHTAPAPSLLGILLSLGALPMANVLAVGILIARRRPGSRPFLLGFEVFGAMMLCLYVALAICFPDEVVVPYLKPFIDPIERIIGWNHPLVLMPIGYSVALVLLSGPQVVFAMVGGLLSRRFKVTITAR